MTASQDLRKEHADVLIMINILEALQRCLAQGRSLAREDWAEIVGFLRVFVDRCHHGKEERVLFPASLQVADDEIRDLIGRLLVEHVEGRRLVSALASASGIEPTLPGGGAGERAVDAALASEAIASYVALIRPHIASEERRLFPWADRTLAPEIQVRMREDYKGIEEEVIGLGRHEALERSLERLAERYLPGRGNAGSP